MADANRKAGANRKRFVDVRVPPSIAAVGVETVAGVLGWDVLGKR